jgi:hypothetical protein
MVGETLADTWTVDQRGDPDAAQVIRWTDTRQLQQLRRAESACAHHDPAVGERLL